ncbi:Nif11-like leader peptide family natural product precursor [Aliinostoc sp. HNIBRCY26]|uniref:Nif11-like leader peptide family natural product precursor n=1 Tax=Aliinostoc sp. HNIBRCY26 TaxID=3418997 RepID=UPI003CFC1A63
MSFKDASTFYEKMKGDDKFNQRVKDLSIEEMAVYAKKVGLNFTEDELLKVMGDEVTEEYVRLMKIKEREQTEAVKVVIMGFLVVSGIICLLIGATGGFLLCFIAASLIGQAKL